MTYSSILLLTIILTASSSAETSGLRRTYRPSRTPVQPARLNFRANGNGSWVFNVMQLTDLHLGENAWDAWGPQQDVDTYKALTNVFLHEPSVDLIILSGDQLTANNVDANATKYYQILDNFMRQQGHPYAMMFGNHDDQPLQRVINGTLYTFPAKTSRQQLAQAVMHTSNYSLTQMGPSTLPGVSNYWLNLYLPASTNVQANNDTSGLHNETLAARILLLDTGGGSLPQQITVDHLDWIRQTTIASLPTLTFAHIPTTDFAWHAGCVGINDDRGIAPLQDGDAGLVQALQNLSAVLAVGHNHGNDYCCPGNNLTLCFGRQSGHGGYSGNWTRGARIYQLELTADLVFSWRSHVRTEYGHVVDEYSPSQASV